MSRSGHHAVDAARKAADPTASGQFLHEFEDAAIVGQKVEQIDRRVVGETQLDADLAVFLLDERAAIDAVPDVFESVRRQ